MQQAVLGETLDRGDPLPGRVRGGQLAGLHGPAADQDRARAAGAFAAAALRAGQAQVFPQQSSRVRPASSPAQEWVTPLTLIERDIAG